MNKPILLTAAILAGLGGCSQYEFYTQSRVDFFQQINRQTVDILLVVDNSCSMIEEQTKLGDNFDGFIQYFDASESDYQIAAVTTDAIDAVSSGRMLGGDDEIVLRDSGGSLIDSLTYTRDWPLTEGAALSLDPAWFNPGDNDKIEAWCVATSSYGAGDLGTPGAANPVCAAAGPFPPDTGETTMTSEDTGDTGGAEDTSADDTATTTSPDDTDVTGDDTGDTGGGTATTDDTGATTSPDDTGDAPDGPREPRSGEVIITEFMSDPAAVADIGGEWVELHNLSDEALSLAGCVLADDGRNAFTFPSGASIDPGQYLVVARTLDESANGGAGADVETGAEFTLQNNVVLLTNQTEGAEEIFAEMVAVGITGAGLEMGLEGARLALSEPMLSGDNAGFLREDANLSIIFLSDEDDMSPYALDDYERFFIELKGDEAYRNPQRMSISAVVGDEPPSVDGQPSCSSSNGEAIYGSRYVELVSRTQGQLESICDEDFSQLAEELGLLISGLSLEFELSDQPNESTLEVSLYETDDDDSLIGVLEKDVDYSYVIDRNSVRFEEEQLPPPGTWIRVEYELLATGASNVESEGSEESSR